MGKLSYYAPDAQGSQSDYEDDFQEFIHESCEFVPAHF